MFMGKRNCREGGRKGREGLWPLNQDGESTIGLGKAGGGTGGTE
jgi:hypothetical protein